MTNRDKFNKMSNAELASVLIWTGANDRCKFCCYTRERCFGKSCFDSIKKWLNSTCADEPENPPAEKTRDKINLMNNTDDLAVRLKEATIPITSNAGLIADRLCDINPHADNVNHPAHYTFGNIEVIDFIEDKKLGFHLGNAVKYISRAGRKDTAKTIEDLRKAAWYLNRQIERLERDLGGQNG